MALKTYTDEAELRSDAENALDKLLEIVRGKRFTDTTKRLESVMAAGNIERTSGAAIFAAALHRLLKQD